MMTRLLAMQQYLTCNSELFDTAYCYDRQNSIADFFLTFKSLKSDFGRAKKKNE